MTPDLSAARIYTDFSGLADLRVAARNNSPEALKEVATQFEALFVNMMLKSMRDASLAGGVFDSQESALYQGMFDQQIAMGMAGRNSFGIADMLVKQLQPAGVGAMNAARMQGQPEFDSAAAYIDSMRPHAEAAAPRLGIKAEALLAQSALETNWGKRIIRDRQGLNSHNMFGIKAGGNWNGDSVSVPSLEYSEGMAKMHSSMFRVYGSYQDSFNDYVDFIKHNSRYQEVLQKAGNVREYIHGLGSAGYATDPAYAQKILNIMDSGIIRTAE